MSKIEEEVADVFIYVLSLANQLGIDLEEGVQDKIQQNEHRLDENRVEETTAELALQIDSFLSDGLFHR